MQILDTGHAYALKNYDSPHKDGQILKFMKREGEGFPFNSSSYAGTNCQEVLRALIDRTEYLMKQKPCAETEAIIGLLKTSLLLFETRAARKHGLELNLDYNMLSNEPCETCGHLVCNHKKYQYEFEEIENNV